MIQQFFKNPFNTTMHLQLFKQILKCSLLLSLLVYAAIRLIFFDLPIEWMEEIMMLYKTLLTGSVFATGISSVLLTADALQYMVTKIKALSFALALKRSALSMLLLILIISACSAQAPVTGIVKDNTTGLTATYKNIKPAKVLLVMNDEVLHHTDIPFGESFLLVNKGIKGLVIKDGKVSVGCSLTIKDKAGKIILKSDDLFNGNDIFKKDSLDFLKCTVSTGKPMKWEEKYNVTVVFWDKYGTGKIENRVTIRCIDIP